MFSYGFLYNLCTYTNWCIFLFQLAYVCGEAEGLIVEEPLHVNGMQKGSTKLDIELEKQLIEEKLKEFKAHNTDKEVITSVMKSFGLAR